MNTPPECTLIFDIETIKRSDEIPPGKEKDYFPPPIFWRPITISMASFKTTYGPDGLKLKLQTIGTLAGKEEKEAAQLQQPRV